MSEDQAKSESEKVICLDSYAIAFDHPLVDFSTAVSTAYHAENIRNPEISIFALAIAPGMPYRHFHLKTLSKVTLPGMITLLDSAILYAPILKRRVHVLIYIKPTGGRLANNIHESTALKGFSSLPALILPLAVTLKQLQTQNLTHRAIRPTNMYWANAQRDRILLGDCIATPPAYEQPSLCETIESAMTHHSARGNGSIHNDFYSLGASIALLSQSKPNSLNVTDDKMIIDKIREGSFSYMTEKITLTSPAESFFRGTLTDNETERWGYENIVQWEGDRNVSIPKSKGSRRATRAFYFDKKELFFAREVVQVINQNWNSAFLQLTSGGLELWVRRSLENVDKAVVVASVLSDVHFNARIDQTLLIDAALVKICAILDSSGPIYFRGISFMPEAWENAVILGILGEGTLEALIEAMRSRITKYYSEVEEKSSAEVSMLDSIFRTNKDFLDREHLGYGIEHVIYRLGEKTPCLSPMTINWIVLSLNELLPALEIYAKKGYSAGEIPFDKHIAAFILVRSDFETSKYYTMINSKDEGRSILGILSLFSQIQLRSGRNNYPALTLWFVQCLKPAINRYNNVTTRQKLEKEVNRIANDGSLIDLMQVIDNNELYNVDMMELRSARMEWKKLGDQLLDIKNLEPKKQFKLVLDGQRLAATISLVLSLIICLIIVLKRFF
jgi:hypothetical protein